MRRQLFFGFTWLFVAALAVVFSVAGTGVVRNAVTSPSVTQYASDTFSDAMSFLNESVPIAEEAIVIEKEKNDESNILAMVDSFTKDPIPPVPKNKNTDRKAKIKKVIDTQDPNMSPDESFAEYVDDTEYDTIEHADVEHGDTKRDDDVEYEYKLKNTNSQIEWIRSSGGSAFVRCSELKPRVVGWNVADGYAFDGIVTEMINEQYASKVVFTNQDTESTIIAQCDNDGVIYEVTETQIALSASISSDDTLTFLP